MKKSLKALCVLAAVPLSLAACTPTPETIVVVVPDLGTQIQEPKELMVNIDNFDSDVVIVREGLSTGDIFFQEFFHYMELKNTSQSTVYYFDFSVTSFDENGEVWDKKPLDDDGGWEIIPGQSVVMFSLLERPGSASEPKTVETQLLATGARGVVEDDIGRLSLSQISFTKDQAGNTNVSGNLTNNGPVEVRNIRIDTWCTDTDGNLKAFAPKLIPWNYGDGPVAPGETVILSSFGIFERTVLLDKCQFSLTIFDSTFLGGAAY